MSETGDSADTSEAATSVDFHAATNLDTAAITQVQAQVRQRILRAFVRRGLIGKRDRDEMMSWEHGGGFSLDASVCIGGTDRAGLERLLRYCARPPFALEHLHPLDAEHLIYHNPKPRSDSPRDLVLTPLELIDKIAALIPPPLLRCAGTQFADGSSHGVRSRFIASYTNHHFPPLIIFPTVVKCIPKCSAICW